MFTKDKRLLRIPQEDCCQALSVPWTLKYESEGGPGVQQILKLLAGSDDAETDRRNFLKAIIAFWLLGATDGHAKNFSVFLSPGGGYRLTPIYDVVSAQPSLAAKQIRQNKMKMAMAVGDTRHYTVESVVGRHFVQSAIKAGLGRAIAFDVIEEILEAGPTALERVATSLPKDFPGAVSEPIVEGFRSRLALLASSLE